MGRCPTGPGSDLLFHIRSRLIRISVLKIKISIKTALQLAEKCSRRCEAAFWKSGRFPNPPIWAGADARKGTGLKAGEAFALPLSMNFWRTGAGGIRKTNPSARFPKAVSHCAGAPFAPPTVAAALGVSPMCLLGISREQPLIATSAAKKGNTSWRGINEGCPEILIGH